MNGPLRGVVLIIIASAFVAMTTVIAKVLGTGEGALSPFQITWGRYFFALIALVCFWGARRPTIAALNLKLHMVRTTFGVTGVTAFFAASTLVPLADATAISFLNPIFAMGFAAIFLRERVGPIRWAMAALAFVGMLFLIRPGATSFQPAALIALLAALLIGVEVTVVKILSGREPMFQILLMSNVAGTVVASLAMLWFWQWPTPEQWGLLVLIGLIMLSAQSLYIPALKSGDASFIVPFSYATLIFAALYDLAFFDVIPVPLSLLGGGIILTSGIVLAWREGRARS